MGGRKSARICRCGCAGLAPDILDPMTVEVLPAAQPASLR